MQILLVKCLKGQYTELEFLRESDDPSKGMNYCCPELQSHMVCELSPIQLSIHTRKLILVGDLKKPLMGRHFIINLDYCPCCGEKFEYMEYRTLVAMG